MSVELFRDFLKKHNLDVEIVESRQSTSTAKEAAEAQGVPVSNIVKSLVVKANGEFFVCLCPGDRRLDFEALRRSLGKKEIRMATAAEVKEATGHSIGGVPPFGHKNILKTIIIEGFDKNQYLWAAAGAANANFRTTFSELEEVLRMLGNYQRL
jgi:prolyl-tRNA editing enzyme YbaK/EbsC (Cys-tRNA(Pro) deacylase)